MPSVVDMLPLPVFYCKSLHDRKHQSPDLSGLDIFQVLMGCFDLCDNGEKMIADILK